MKVTLRRQLEMQGVGDETRGWEIVIQGDSVLFTAEDVCSLLSNILKCSREYCLYLGIYSLTDLVIHFHLSPQVLPFFI